MEGTLEAGKIRLLVVILCSLFFDVSELASQTFQNAPLNSNQSSSKFGGYSTPFPVQNTLGATQNIPGAIQNTPVATQTNSGAIQNNSVPGVLNQVGALNQVGVVVQDGVVVQGNASAAPTSEPFPLSEVFNQLNPSDKAKFSWNLPNGWTIRPFGFLRGEMVYASNQTAADAVQFFFTPNSLGVDDDTFTVHGKTSFLNFALSGPEKNGWRPGGALIINFLGPQPLRNQSGFNVVNAFGFIENDRWKFSAGRMLDLLGPRTPNTVNAGQQRGAGNVGIFRGAFQVDRFIQVAGDQKWTLSGRLSQNTVNDFLLLPTARGKDNGFPNFEGRIGLDWGPLIDGQAPVQLGISGVWGETRAFDPARIDVQQGELIFLGALQEVSTTAAVVLDFRFANERSGIHGEFFMGQAAGTYFIGVLQTLNSETGQGIRSIGGWVEGWHRWSDVVVTNLGAGIDDPRNQDLGFITTGINDPGQRTYNSVIWTNLLYSVSDTWELGFEVSYRDTHYLNDLSSSEGFLTHFRSSIRY